ncbi:MULTISPECIES: isochorismatase family protein [unclassified Crossiella]|uniref:isochorismatase family protein n=1 Tax=unclassified Crossiella TaxID=2620835 RepID=UPI001FFEDB06|nr:MULTISPECIES: isochorismatase family protein [unclassified Crossiella]MCK2244102.1 isochorismatase family protein [Crossiella sp. S99.2]MCK2257906.1 isochorismatase family protein [Crossiella sp. S99.1]
MTTMGLPAIKPYALPEPEELPQNRVDWRVDPARAVLLVHDMQNHFLDAFPRADSPLPAVLANIDALRKHCTAAGIPVVFTAQPGGQSQDERGLLLDFWGNGLPSERRAESIVDELAPAPTDIVMTKWRYSAFVRTDLAEFLGERDQLIVTGVYGHIGVLTTALDAFMREVKPFVVADAVADFSRADHLAALHHVAQRCGHVLTTATLVDALLGVAS